MKDEASGNDFGHEESRDGDFVKGQYRVLLPDGRMQIVKYEADQNGYRPTVEYEGEANDGSNGPYPASGSANGNGNGNGGYASNGGYSSGGPSNGNGNGNGRGSGNGGFGGSNNGGFGGSNNGGFGGSNNGGASARAPGFGNGPY